jgi:hypothetical protein
MWIPIAGLVVLLQVYVQSPGHNVGARNGQPSEEWLFSIGGG